MSEAQNCNHDCGSCTANCDSRVPDKKSFEEKLAEGCSVKKVIGVVSGKGGVGKSGDLFNGVPDESQRL